MSGMIKSKKYTGVYSRKKADGDITYYFVYKNIDRKPTYQKVGLKSQGITEQYVYEKRNEFVLELKNGEIPKLLRSNKQHVIKFNDIAEYYFTNRVTRSSVKRKKLYELRLKPEFGNKSVYSIKTTDILEFRNRYAKKFAPHTVNLYIELMSTIFNYYNKYKHKNIDNPTLRVDKLQVNNIRNRILSLDEIDFMFHELRHDFVLSLFCGLCLCSGARKSTVLNYKVKDVSMSHRTINSYDFKNQTSYVSFIDNRTYELLEHRFNATYDVNPDTPLIYVDGVTDLARWINRQLKPIFDIFNKGLEVNDRQYKVVIHTFRHTLLSHLGMKGVNSQLIQKISNHKDSSMVDRYVKLNENIGKKEIIDVWKK